MTYYSRGRSLGEVIAAVIFIGFMTGFIAVLCIGNYYRAKKAMERQKQRRLTRFSNGGNGVAASNAGVAESPRSHPSSSSGASSENQHLLSKPPELPRRRNNDGNDLLLFEEKQPNVARV